MNCKTSGKSKGLVQRSSYGLVPRVVVGWVPLARREEVGAVEIRPPDARGVLRVSARTHESLKIKRRYYLDMRLEIRERDALSRNEIKETH